MTVAAFAVSISSNFTVMPSGPAWPGLAWRSLARIDCAPLCQAV